ncbi:MAG: 2-hydroxyacid dehydrogenase [Candidatus Kryptoniota bacterium]
MKEKVFITREIPKIGIELLKKYFQVEVNSLNRDLTQFELARKLRDASAVVSMLSNRFDRDFIKELKGLKVISNYAVGYNNIDVEAATEKGIIVTNTPGVLTDATADMTFALLLAAARRIPEGDRFMRAGKFKGWSPLLMLGYDVAGKTIGIIGAGRIGTAVAARAKGFAMKILYYSRKKSEVIEELGGRFVSLNKLLMNSDFVSINVPLNDETRGMIGRKELSLMKKTSILVNTARGEVVDENALIEYLIKNKIAAAGLDVYAGEPRINPKFKRLGNVVLTPHVGSGTFETRSKMAELAARNVIAALKGKHPPSVVNPEVMLRKKLNKTA